MPLTSGVSGVSSAINWGANVPAGVLMRFELERKRVESLRHRGVLSCVNDWWRAWPILLLSLSDSDSGDEMRPDLGRGRLGVGPGNGVAEFLAKGLFRHRGPVGAGALML
jgi:hypothetical protein